MNGQSPKDSGEIQAKLGVAHRRTKISIKGSRSDDDVGDDWCK